MPAMMRVAAIVVMAWAVGGCSTRGAGDQVVLERVPDHGVQAQALADSSGTIHIVYIAGDPAAGNISYVRRAADGTYSKGIRVNSQPGSAIALGSVRGPQLAIGRGGRVHVVWNGSERAQPRQPGGMPLLYARLDDSGSRFESQRNLATWAGQIDGGGTIATDTEGRVYAAWHTIHGGGTDANGAVYITRSDDDGATFPREWKASDPTLGACACCGMRALGARNGSVYMVFRAAGHDVDRDTTLLTSSDGGATFDASRLHPWKLQACPLSTASLAEGPRGVAAVWETEQQIFFAHVGPGPNDASPPESAPGSGHRKHPIVTFNARGEALLAWLEGTAYGRGGSLAWQVYDPQGRATTGHGTAPGVPVWGLAAGAPLPDGRFLLLY